MKDLLWTLFKKTGDIKYYLMYNKLGGTDEGNNRGNSSK